MNVLLWIVQAILAVAFALSGLVKVLQPKDKLAGKYPWMQDVSQATVRLIGTLDGFGHRKRGWLPAPPPRRAVTPMHDVHSPIRWLDPAVCMPPNGVLTPS